MRTSLIIALLLIGCESGSNERLLPILTELKKCEIKLDASDRWLSQAREESEMFAKVAKRCSAEAEKLKTLPERCGFRDDDYTHNVYE